MVDRKWLPSDWMDEMPPATGKSPDEFLRREPKTGQLQLYPLDLHDEADWFAAMVRDLARGDEVSFMWHEPRGSRTMTVQEDGTWSLNEPFAQDANCFDDEDGNFGVTNDLAEIAANLRGEAQEFPTEVEVDGWTWSNRIVFRVEVDGTAARFEEVGAVQ